jgi:hypothetical protein
LIGGSDETPVPWLINGNEMETSWGATEAALGAKETLMMKRHFHGLKYGNESRELSKRDSAIPDETPFHGLKWKQGRRRPWRNAISMA